MKRLFVSAALVALSAVPALMAQNEQIFYGWDSHIVQRVGTTVTPQGQFRSDTNRFDMTVPLLIPGQDGDLIIKGVGQIFAPRHFWRFYDPYYNGESTEGREQPYIDQFKGVQAWSLDSVRIAVFHNSDNLNPQFPAQLDLYKLNTDYSVNRNSDSGIAIDREDLNETNLVAQKVLSEEELMQTVNEQGAIIPTTLEPEPAIEFGKDESALLMYINDFAEPITQPINDGDTREWQRVIGYVEYQDGDGSETNKFHNPIPHNMIHGVILRSVNGVEVVTNTYRAISFDTPPLEYAANFNVLWFGVVELNPDDLPEGQPSSSVRYHFGYDATEQGLGAVTPNPVREEAIIPFSLTEVANVTVELFKADGQKVATLINDHKYIEGKYSIKMSAEDLESGSYLVRMSANDKSYSMKLIVTK